MKPVFLDREFRKDGQRLPDPNKELPPSEVLNIYSNTYPELTNAQIVGPTIEDNKQVYEFKTVLGTKG